MAASILNSPYAKSHRPDAARSLTIRNPARPFGDSGKWDLPGWRLEKYYHREVLIGNWFEKRLKFERGAHNHNSTHKVDFQHSPWYKPEVRIRRAALEKNEGLGKEHIFKHHGDAYSNNPISGYDEFYNRRGESKLPQLRYWHKHQCGYWPERSDHPLQGTPSGYGLRERLRSEWERAAADERRGLHWTSYATSYTRPHRDVLITAHRATPRSVSSHFNAYNNVNKNLHLRSTCVVMAPDPPPTLLPPRDRQLK